MNTALAILEYLALGVLTAFVILFLSHLKNWGVEDFFIPMIVSLWPFAILFLLMFVTMLWVNGAARKAADMYDEWRYRRNIRMRKDDEDGSSN